MRHLDIETCQWLSVRWFELIRAGYTTAIRADDGVAVMWKGFAARDYVYNVMGGNHVAQING
jgi:hypothetical protein